MTWDEMRDELKAEAREAQAARLWADLRRQQRARCRRGEELADRTTAKALQGKMGPDFFGVSGR